jgi:hypothetical protein
VCDLAKERTRVSAHFGKKTDGFVAWEASLSLNHAGDSYCASLSCVDASRMNEFVVLIEKYLTLVRHSDQSTQTEWDAIDKLRERVMVLEKALQASERKLTIFLSYRFDPVGKNYASTVRDLLELVGVTVVTGESYEPRTIQDKVKSRLEGIDAVVLIQADDDKSAWVRDEINRAQTPVIPLVQSGLTFDKGLFGDLEFIEFKQGHIADTFTKLLEGLNFLTRIEKRKNSSKKKKSE